MHLRPKISSAVAILLTCQSALLAQSPQKIVGTSICKIFSKPSAYDGKLVRIRAVYAGSFEGSYLFDPKCGKDVWFTTPISAVAVSGLYPKVAEPSFSLIEDKEYQKFKHFAYPTAENLQPSYRVTATFTGRIDQRKGFKIEKNAFGNGFGHLGGSEFQFILRSVSDVAAEEAKGNLEPTQSVLRNQIPEHR
jgi:hypothetical protein